MRVHAAPEVEAAASVDAIVDPGVVMEVERFFGIRLKLMLQDSGPFLSPLPHGSIKT
jgi:hypothetical protein